MIAAATGLGSVVLDNWHHDGGGPWFLFFPLLWGLVILGIIWIVRRSPPWRGREHAGPRPESGVEILERRLAEGDLEVGEYRQRRSILDGEDRR